MAWAKKPRALPREAWLHCLHLFCLLHFGSDSCLTIIDMVIPQRVPGYLPGLVALDSGKSKASWDSPPLILGCHLQWRGCTQGSILLRLPWETVLKG